MISLEHRYLDILAKDLADSIDNEVLYTARGWTIIQAPEVAWSSRTANKVHEWMGTHCGEYHMWDGQIAFKEAQDATLFLLRWS
jgi:hypothetical protein